MSNENGSAPPPDEERLSRLKASIARQVDQRREEEKARDGSASAAGTGLAMGLGFRVASELIANVLVGGGIGWALDKWLGTSPILLLVFLLLGVASGFWSVYRIATRPIRPNDPER